MGGIGIKMYLYQIAVDCFFIFQMSSESVPHVSLTVLYSIHYGALRPVMMDAVVLRVTTLSLLYACTCREPHKFEI